MMTPDKYSNPSYNLLSKIQSPTRNTQKEKLSQQWMLFIPLKNKEEPCMDTGYDKYIKKYFITFSK